MITQGQNLISNDMDVDKTTENDESTLEDNDTEHENDSSSEGEGTQEEERTYTQAEVDDLIAAEGKRKDHNWRDRLKKASGEDGEKGSQESDSKKEVVASDDVTLARLEARGILDTDIQNYLLTAAKREGKNPVDLLSDSYFQDKVAAMQREKEQESARPTPSSRTGTNDRSNDLGFWMKQAEKGKLPPDRAMREKVLSKLAGR